LITGSSPLIANEKDAKVVHPKSLAGQVGGRGLEARFPGCGSVHCAAGVQNNLQSEPCGMPEFWIGRAIFLFRAKLDECKGL
jgi:hypothetical protein